jgi:aryl-alcohol dehydrogenase-like predicted oxidoreductase
VKTRAFGTSGERVSEIGLGCWQLGGADFGPVAEETALAILDAASEGGVTFFDTADVYGAGRSEEIIGRFLRRSREKRFIATKFGRMGEGFAGASLPWLRAATEASLRRLGVEALDLTQIHCPPTELLRRGEIFEWLRTLQREGKIRHFGASVESMEEARLCLAQPGLLSLQIIFNVLRQRPVHELMAEAKRRGVALIVRLPMASGLLSGHLRAETRFAEGDHRHYNRDGQRFNVGETFSGLPFEKGVELVERLKTLLPPGSTLAQLALRYCLDFDAVSVVIPGATKVAQVRENVRASSLAALPAELHARLSAFYRDEVDRHVRGPY